MESLISLINEHSKEALQHLPIAITIIFIGVFIKSKSRFLAFPFFSIGTLWILWAFIGLYQL